MRKYLINWVLILLSVLSYEIALSQTPIYSEDFEGGSLPTGWTQVTQSSDGGWKFGLNTALQSADFDIPSHTKFACTNDAKCHNASSTACDKSNDMLISKPLDFSGYTKLQMSVDEYFWGGEWNGYVETATFKATIDDGKTWTTLGEALPAGDWFNQLVDLTPVAGNSNVKIAFVYNDGGGGVDDWLYGFAIDNIKIYEPSDYDVSIYSITSPKCFRSGDQTIIGWLQNRGATSINTLTINYQIDSNPAVSENLTSLGLASTDFYKYTFTTPWDAKPEGTHTLKVWASNINGNIDQNTTNDENTTSLNVFKAGRPVLVEYFTQASCSYCAVYVPRLEGTVDTDKDFAIGLSYHTSWPGVDPMQTTVNKSDCSSRVSYYGVTGTPTAYTNGSKASELLYSGGECELATATTKDTVVTIENATASLSGTTLSFSADITAKKKLTGSYKTFVAIIEKEISFTTAPGTNGQKVFPDVMRKMYPDGNGTALPSGMTAGTKKNISGTWTLSNVYKNAQLRVIYFVQNVSTKEVVWAALINPFTSDIEENNGLKISGIYPNPAKEEARITFNLLKQENINIRIFNSMGETVFMKELDKVSAGGNSYTIDLNNFTSGIYFAEISNGAYSSTRKISVVK